MMNEKIRSIMTTDVITLAPQNTLGQARAILLQNGVHHLPVIDGGKLVGILTSYDMFKTGKSADQMKDIKVADVMSTHLSTLSPDDHIGTAAEVLLRNFFHAIPIVTENKDLAGILTTYDILKYEFEKEYPDNLDKFVPENMV
jgi:CBS domain-containing protein